MSIEVTNNQPAESVSAKSVLDAKVVETETKASPETIQESEQDTEAVNEQDADSQADESTDDESTSEQVDKENKPKKKGGFQKRIERFQRDLQAERQRNEYLQSLLSNQQKPEEKPVQRTDPAGKPKIEDFESMADFTEAVADWKVEQRLKEQEAKTQQEKAKTSFQTQVEKFQSDIAAFAKTVDDFDEVREEVSDVMLTPGLQHALMKSKIGPEVLYTLAKDRQKLDAINGLNAFDQAYEIALVEAEIKYSKSTPKESITKQTIAPKPITPIGTKAGAVKKSIYDSDLPQEDYERLRREQMRKRNA